MNSPYSRAVTPGRLIRPHRRDMARQHKPIPRLTDTQRGLLMAAVCSGAIKGEMKEYIKREL